MCSWYLRPGTKTLISWSTESNDSNILPTDSSWAGKLLQISATVVVSLGVGLLYFEYLHRQSLIERQKARKRRQARLLKEKNKEKLKRPVPIYSLPNQSNRCVECECGFICSLHGAKNSPQDFLMRSQLYRVWDTVPTAKEIEKKRGLDRNIKTERILNELQSKQRARIHRGNPDGGEAGSNEDSFERVPSMKDIIQSAKDVQDLIRNSSLESLDILQEESENLGQRTMCDFKDILQLTSIDDTWSDTRSVISSTPRHCKRRQSVLSCGTDGCPDLDWEGEMLQESNNGMELFIRCGDIVTSETSISLVMA